VKRLLLLSLSLLLLFSTGTTYAQDAPASDAPPAANPAGSPILPGSVPSDTWVTTQDFVALRRGPGKAFAQTTTVPAALTIPAYGRTSDTGWIQVEYQGQRGWIAARYLVWTGDVINLPVDGVNPEPFIRRAATVGVFTRDALSYVDWADPNDRGMVIPTGTAVELTGRIGDDEGNYERNFFRIQIRYQGVFYWVGSYDLRLVDGDYRRLLDLAYLFPYGKLFLGLQDNIALAIGSYRQISDVWARLGSGVQVSCEPIPPLVEKRITDADATREPTFTPAVAALGRAIDGINGAITAFRDACANPAFTLTPFYIGVQAETLNAAYRELLLAASMQEPLRVRNPLLHH
jgi:hypothetical protein